ncbi:DUF1365 domain-containing protein [Blastochloris tepida]|nr:DUF1365 domain-containing protein [Blastochloris tepida]
MSAESRPLASQRPPPEAAASLFEGVVMHARLRPVGHRFRYRVTSLLIDIDRLAEADRLSPLFSVGRFNLWGFSEADHGAGDGSPLRPWVDDLLAAAGAPHPTRVLLLCYPRVFGAAFDPLSVYWCYAASGELAAIIYSVRNTFGERHAYVCPLMPGEASVAEIRQQAEKRFFVSPFNALDQRYLFRMRPPGEDVAVRILQTDAEGPLLAATFSGHRRALNTANLLRAFFVHPMMTAKVLGAIHWEALRLWLKGVPVRLSARPATAPPPASRDGEFLPTTRDAKSG